MNCLKQETERKQQLKNVYSHFFLVNGTKDLPTLHSITYLYLKSLNGLWLSFIISYSKENVFCVYSPVSNSGSKNNLVY